MTAHVPSRPFAFTPMCPHAFAHVQVAHETEVKAQIKLRFVTQGGQQVTVVRSFQVCWLVMLLCFCPGLAQPAAVAVAAASAAGMQAPSHNTHDDKPMQSWISMSEF